MARSLQERLETEPIKADKKNLHEIKVALDDALVKYLTEEAGYTEDHSQMNLKLFISFILNVVGGATALYTYYVPFESSRFYTAIGSGIFLMIYFLWNGYTMFLQSPLVFSGSKLSGKGQKVQLKSELSLKDSVYRVRLLTDQKKSFRDVLSNRVDRWVTEDGFIAPKSFFADMQTAMNKISTKYD